MWGVGGGRSISFGDRKVNAQMWYENYDDYTRIVYADSFLSWNEYAAAPKIGLQFIRGLSEGKALAGEVNSTSYGAQLSMKLAPSLAWTLNYNHIAANGNAYGNGAPGDAVRAQYLFRPLLRAALLYQYPGPRQRQRLLHRPELGRHGAGFPRRRYSFMDLTPRRAPPAATSLNT